ncbi:MAG: molecular chaperone HtpG [Bdellovibrionia bacterium]
MSKTTQTFNAEIKQLLDIVVHSLYSNKEIFLRELISNASDAIDKRKFQSLTHSEMAFTDEPMIRLEPNKENKTLKIIDNGIGMKFDEVVEFIGTIAKSGTKAFVHLNEEFKKRPEMIGQFGVGFYSAFMVADKVTLHTQKAGTDEGVLWESEGQGTYSIDRVPRSQGPGTTITLHLKDFKEEDEVANFTDEWTLKSLVKKYSDFIAHPIKLKTEKEDETLNSQKALWLRSPAEVKEDEYKEFYQHLTHDWNSPTKWVHYKAEGTIEFSSLLYIPSKKPWNFNMKDYEYGLQLFIKRVFIMDNCKDLLPPYLRFVKGLVDSTDLSLNVSRELLQQDRQVGLIKKNVVTKIFNTFKDFLQKDRAGYESFFKEFGSTLKEGIPLDPTQKEKISELLLLATNKQDALSTLDEYIERMPSMQKAIYFITGDKIEKVKSSPYLEKLEEKGFEVLFLVDPVDEWVTQELKEYKGKKLQSITSENLDLDSDEEKAAKEEKMKSHRERFASLLESLKGKLAQNVADVRLSDRLTNTPSCLVAAEGNMSAHMQKLLSQMGGDMAVPDQKRILELNPNHPVVDAMLNLTGDQQQTWGEILYNQALIAEGSDLPNPNHYTKLITELMLKSHH